jgi:hypothetical protein
MGGGRPVRRKDLCHAKRDFVGLDLLSEPIELLMGLSGSTTDQARPEVQALPAVAGSEGSPKPDKPLA